MSSSSSSKVSVRDKHFIIGWSLSDTNKIEQYTEMLRSLYNKPEFQEQYTQLADKMVNLITKKENDHHNATAELGHDWLKVDPEQIQIGEDMVTFLGINKVLKIYYGAASGTFKWMARGTAASTPTPYSTALATETGTRQDATATGFTDVKGASLRVFSTYPTSTATATMFQIGIFDAVTTGTMLAIHDFGSTSFTHTLNADSFSLGMIIDFMPFGDV